MTDHKIKIRSINISDYESAGNTIKASIRDTFKELYPTQLLEEFCAKYDLERFKLKAQEIDFFVAEEETKKIIVGIIGIKGNELRTFFVHPKYQGHGVGRLLYDRFEVEARKRGLREITLEGSPIGEPIYKHFGFSKIKTITKERVGIKYTDAVMIKKL